MKADEIQRLRELHREYAQPVPLPHPHDRNEKAFTRAAHAALPKLLDEVEAWRNSWDAAIEAMGFGEKRLETERDTLRAENERLALAAETGAKYLIERNALRAENERLRKDLDAA